MMVKTAGPTLGVILLFALIASAANAGNDGTAGNAAELYNKGNAAFRDKDYKTAQNLYLRALSAAEETGIKNSALFNNLATAYMMNGETGKAVLYYKRALRLSPRDRLVRENLKRAADTRKDRIAGPETTAPFGKFLTHYSSITLNEHAAILLFLFTLLGITILFARSTHTKGQPARQSRLQVIIGVAALMQILLLSTKTIYMSNIKEGVVLGETVTVRSEPNIDSEKVFEIHSGMECLVLNQEKGYIEIQLSTGWKGWVSHQHIEII
jgi:hypothetical protein